ncbi:MAG: lysophospholipid acyltransferase family protein [Bacteroidia bacterium]|nr:lysophospholipid acyltransferase family protein [Bacteroidia bacterium]
MIYTIIKNVFQVISYLPLGLLYKLSDVIFLIMYYLLRYRRKIVESNLDYAFPEKSYAEKQKISRQFYQNLCDMLVETIKMFSLSEKELQKRFIISDPTLCQICSTQKNVVLLLGHQFNWEWGNWFLHKYLQSNFVNQYKIICVYTPIKNKLIDNLIKELRTAKGSIVSKSKDKNLLQLAAPTITAMVADQNPSNLKTAYWCNFMHRKVPCHAGFEKLIYKTQQIPVFAKVEKIKRGYYQASFHMPFETLPPYKKGVLIEPFFKFLEKCIHEEPANYLWSHRRWKHSPNNSMI